MMNEHHAVRQFGVADCNRKRYRTSNKINLDRRRETSRYAARDRRGKEANIFTHLKEVVPIVEEATVTHVDRIALLRVASTMFRLRKHASKLLKTNLCEERSGLWAEATLLESLDGFVAIVDSDGVILYVTESVSIYLGLTQTDLTGRSLKEFVHPSDYDEFAKSASDVTDSGHMTVLRMKSVISPRGRNLNLKSALYKPINCRLRAVTDEGGRLRVLQCSAQPAGQGSIASAAAKNDVPNGTYMTRHTCDMKFSYVSESFNYILRRETRSLMGTSFYNLVHPADIEAVAASMRELLSKGHTKTPYYRLIGAAKTVLWVQTEATTVNHTSKGHKGQYVICIHELLGSQNELESFVVDGDCRVSRELPMHSIKKELDDSPERHHPTPVYIRNRTNDPDPPLATAALFVSRVASPESCVDEIIIGQDSSDNVNNDSNATGNSTDSFPRNADMQYSPLTAGVAECDPQTSSSLPCRKSALITEALSRTSGGVQDSGCSTGTSRVDATARGTVVRSAESIECGAQRDPTLHDFTIDLPADPFLNTIRLPTASTNDAYPILNADALNDVTTECSNLYSTLSCGGPQYPRSFGYDPYISTAAALSQSSQANNSFTAQLPASALLPPKEIHDDFFDGPDLQLLAPFVAQEDVMQLTTDIQGLLPELNFADWIPADPTPLSISCSETQRLNSFSDTSPALSPIISNPIPQLNLSGSVVMSTSTTSRRPSASSPSRHNSNTNAKATTFRPIPYPTPNKPNGSKASGTNPAHHSFCSLGNPAESVPKRSFPAARRTSFLCSSSTSSNSSSSPVSSRNDVYLSPTNPAHVESPTHTLNKQQLRTDANRLQRVPSSIFIQMY